MIGLLHYGGPSALDRISAHFLSQLYRRSGFICHLKRRIGVKRPRWCEFPNFKTETLKFYCEDAVWMNCTARMLCEWIFHTNLTPRCFWQWESSQIDLKKGSRWINTLHSIAKNVRIKPSDNETKESHETEVIMGCEPVMSSVLVKAEIGRRLWGWPEAVRLTEQLPLRSYQTTSVDTNSNQTLQSMHHLCVTRKPYRIIIDWCHLLRYIKMEVGLSGVELLIPDIACIFQMSGQGSGSQQSTNINPTIDANSVSNLTNKATLFDKLWSTTNW